jgi:long-chain acyl-CoA synthetase
MISESLVVQWDNKLVALVYPDKDEVMDFSEEELKAIMDQNRKELNQRLPNYSRIAEIQLQKEEFAKTPKKSIKRYLYQ